MCVKTVLSWEQLCKLYTRQFWNHSFLHRGNECMFVRTLCQVGPAVSSSLTMTLIEFPTNPLKNAFVFWNSFGPLEIEHYSMWEQAYFNKTWQALSTCCRCHSRKWGMYNSCCIARKAPGITKGAENNWSWTSKLSKSVLPSKHRSARRTGEKIALTQVLLQADVFFIKKKKKI